MERNSHPIQRGRPVSGLEAAHANEYFEQFLNASSLKHILGYYRGLIDYLHLKPNVFLSFYPKLRANLTSWKAKALWKKFDARASHKCYQKGKAATDTKVLVIGGGPCGLRTAIEAQLLGAKVVVIEKRDRFSRNNVLHLWPFVIEDLRMLGAKKFFGKFCAGAIDHISIRRLQCILLKVALLLGVEVHTEVSFEKLIEPNATEKTGWRAEIKPSDHPVSQYEFDVIIGADGKRNTLQGFTRKEFRGKLAIAITANFINKKTEAEARVEEISGVAFIFNQKFFKDLQEATRIDLENIVYYKDDTHYFVMTAKKASLIEKGVIKQDLADTEKLLAPDNVDRMALEAYAIEAASFSTNYQMPDLEFAVNHYGQPDIAMFDFTSMFAADNASKVVERNGYRLLMILVGDSLLEPFWPTGSGCARGFLSALDAAWAIRNWSMGTLTPLDVLAERESIYRLLAQTTPDNLNKDWKSYTLDPTTRYPNLNKAVVMPQQTAGLYDTDNPTSIERMKRNAQEKLHEVPKKRRRGNVDNEVLLSWISEQLRTHEDINVTDIGSIFKDGKILCAIIHHYRPDLLDYSAIKDNDPAKNNQIAFDVLEKELGIPPIMTGEEITNTEDYLTLATYLTQVYDTFKGEIPHIKHPKLKLRSKIPKSLILSQAKVSTSSKTKQKKNVNTDHRTENKSKLGPVHFNASRDLKSSKFKTDTVDDDRNKIDGIKYNPPAPLRNTEEINQRVKHSTLLQRAEKSKLINISEKSMMDIKHESSTIEICDFNSFWSGIESNELLNYSKSKNALDLASIHKHARMTSKKRSSITDLSLKCKNGSKPKSKIGIQKKRLHIKKSKLSVIPEIKIEVTEERSSATLRFPYTIRGRSTFSIKSRHSEKCGKCETRNKEVKVKQEVSEVNVEEENNCKTIYNNNYFRKCETTCSNIYPDSNNIDIKKHAPSVFEYASNSDTTIKIRLFEKKSENNVTYQKIEYVSSLNLVTVSSKTFVSNVSKRKPPYKKNVNYKFISKTKKKKIGRIINRNYEVPNHATSLVFLPNQSSCRINSADSLLKEMKCSGDASQDHLIPATLQKLLQELGSRGHQSNLSNYKCRMKLNSYHKYKFLSKKMTMSEGDGLPDQIYSRVSNWISSHDFQVRDHSKIDTEAETVISNDIPSDITSVTRTMAKKRGEYDDIIIEERTDVVKCKECESPDSSEQNFSELVKHISNNKSVRTLSKFSQYSPFQNSGNLKSASAPPTQFSVIVEGEESVCPSKSYFFLNTLLLLYFSCAIYFYDFCLFCPY